MVKDTDTMTQDKLDTHRFAHNASNNSLNVSW